ncbi:MAG: NUDIX hydrolase N-terminal domain-containing protein [Myxococcota bacterium]
MRATALALADEIRALAQTGLHFCEEGFDRERYERLLQVAVRLAAAASGCEEAVVRGIFERQGGGYVTPKIDVRMAVFRRGEVLLVRERSDGCWALPGGYADVGDSPSEAAIRETREEAGVDVRAERLAGVWDRRLHPEAGAFPFQIYKLVFTGSLLDPDAEPHGGHETSDARFFALDGLPELSLGRTLPLHIEKARSVASHPAEPSHFD